MAEPVDVVVGTVGRPHGLRGEVLVRVHTDYAESRFAPGSVLRRDRADGPALEVAAGRLQGDALLLSFRGITDRSAAEALRGTELWAQAEAVETAPGEFHDAALVGLEVRCAGRPVGRVEAVTHHPAQDLLVVATAAGERLVPFVTELVPVVDLAAGFLEVADLPGLLEEL